MSWRGWRANSIFNDALTNKKTSETKDRELDELETGRGTCMSDEKRLHRGWRSLRFSSQPQMKGGQSETETEKSTATHGLQNTAKFPSTWCGGKMLNTWCPRYIGYDDTVPHKREEFLLPPPCPQRTIISTASTWRPWDPLRVRYCRPKDGDHPIINELGNDWWGWMIAKASRTSTPCSEKCAYARYSPLKPLDNLAVDVHT